MSTAPIDSRPMPFFPDRWWLLRAAAATMAALFIAGLAWRILRESGGTNSYALLAEAYLDGHFDVTRCFDRDCALFDGHRYVIFPPLPALVALPFVALFGASFSGFTALAALFGLGTALLWWRIFARMGASGESRLWLMLAFLFGSPVLFVTMRGEGVWFFAQAAGLFLVSLALHEALARRLVTAGLAVGAAFLCRQMGILLVPFLFALALEAGEPLLDLTNGSWWRRAVGLGLAFLPAVAVYLAYNAVRFGSPFETGYRFIVPDEETYMGPRLTHALFSADYLLFNVFYLLLQGFHAAFDGPMMTHLAGLDPNGSSLLAASPFVLFAFFLPLRRDIVIAALTAAAIAGVTLFYHSNGFAQYNVQRYTLDWLPLLFLYLPLAVTRERLPVFRLLVTYAMALNLAAFAVLALTKGV